jgi:hypothetical protein
MLEEVMQHVVRVRGRHLGLVRIERMALRGKPKVDGRSEPPPDASAEALDTEVDAELKRYVDSDELANILAALAFARELPRAS